MLKRLMKYLRIKHLHLYSVLGRNRYMKHLCKTYSKYGVHFDEILPRYIAHDAVLDTSNPIFIGKLSTIASGTVILTHDFAVCYGSLALNEDDRREFGFFKQTKIGNYTFMNRTQFLDHLGN